MSLQKFCMTSLFSKMISKVYQKYHFTQWKDLKLSLSHKFTTAALSAAVVIMSRLLCLNEWMYVHMFLCICVLTLICPLIFMMGTSVRVLWKCQHTVIFREPARMFPTLFSLKLPCIMLLSLGLAWQNSVTLCLMDILENLFKIINWVVKAKQLF